MNLLLNVLGDGDPCPAIFLAVLLYFVGGLMVQHLPRQHTWGFRLAAGAFLAYAAYGIAVFSPANAGDFVVIALRALLAGALAIGCSWILLATGHFVHAHSVEPVLRAARIAREQSRFRVERDREEREAERRRQRLDEERSRELTVRRNRQEVLDRQQSEFDRHEREAEVKRQEQQRRAEADLGAKRQAVREHLRSYYLSSGDVLAEVCPPAMLEAFIHAEMHDGLSPTELWAVCQKKITELTPLVTQERARKRKEDDRRASRALRLKKIDAEIASVRQKIARLEQSGLEADFIEDEKEGLLLQIRRLEEQHEMLLTLNEDGGTV